MNTVKGKQCQCTKCFRTFSTEANFDKHRKGDYKKGRYCVNPSLLGMEKSDKGIWRYSFKDSTPFWGE